MPRSASLLPIFVTTITAIAIAACSDGDSSRPNEPPRDLPTPAEAREALSGLAFDTFVERSFELLLERSPEAVIDLHLEAQIPVGRSFVDDISDGFVAETRTLEATILELLRGYSETSVTRDVYEWYLDDRVRGHPYADLEYRVSPSVNSVTGNTELFFTDVHPLATADDAEKYAARLWSAGDKIRALVATLERHRSAGILQPRILLQGAIHPIRAVSLGPASVTPYYRTLATKLPAGTDPSVLENAERAIEEAILPAYAELVALLEEELNSAPDWVGVSNLPDGTNYYSWTLRHHTTSEVTPDQLHQLGLDELTRIHADLETRFTMLGYPAGESIRQKIARAASDGGSIPRENIVAAYETIIEDAQMRLPEAFDLLPSSRVVVKGGSVGGFYVPASLDGSRPGAFFAAVGNSEPRFGMRTLAYHEAVPGHHLQIGVAQDLDLPLFQRVVTFTGHAEGWALYAEWLAGDLGWYEGDVYGDIGRLQAEAFRAARLVVDTGLHVKGWTSDQAVEFFMENVGFPEGASTGQIMRYVAWPGQATAYYTGRAKILELRRAAETRLGAQFDVKNFHRAVLGQGSVPLGVLERINQN